MKDRKWTLRFLIVLVILIAPTFLIAQDCSPLDPSYPDCLDPDSPVPIDDGVIVLLVAGVIAGFFFLKQKQVDEINSGD